MELWNPKPQELEPLDVTWSVLDREPGMDDLAEGADDRWTKMAEDLKIYPFQDSDEVNRLFLARFEFVKYGEEFQFPEVFEVSEEPPETPLGFIDFLAGFPIDCVEMLVAIGEFSSKAKEGEDSKVKVFEGNDKVAPPIPKEEFFKWPEEDKILLNLTALVTKDVAKILAKNLEGEPKPITPKWWFRVQLDAGTEESPKKWPVPGEFLGLGIRMFPGSYWGRQKSSPFIYSGNFMDTVYYTSGLITEITDPTDEILYSTYKVQWRKTEDAEDGIVEATPSDFAEYRVGDRVTILKDVGTEKKSQLWKDDDMKEFGGELDNWTIAPISFYGLDTQEEA